MNLLEPRKAGRVLVSRFSRSVAGSGIPVEEIWHFGSSAATGLSRSPNDVDIAVVIDEDRDVRSWLLAAEDLFPSAAVEAVNDYGTHKAKSILHVVVFTTPQFARLEIAQDVRRGTRVWQQFGA